MTATTIYKGNLRTELTHLQSGAVIETDAPLDNHGKGERFSPTDLVATAYGSCMLTVMGIKARDMNIDLGGATVEITKVMGATPRRIATIVAKIIFPKLNLDEQQKTILERVAMGCPVGKSLHPDIALEHDFIWTV